ncbi:MAG: ATP-binding protein [Bacillota bacterium]
MSGYTDETARLRAQLTAAYEELAEARRRLAEQGRLALRKTRQRDALLTIAGMASSGRPMEETLQTLVRHAGELLEAEGAAFGSLVPGGGALLITATWGMAEPFRGERMQLAGSWTSQVMCTGQYLLFDNRCPDVRANHAIVERFHIRSIIAVPFRIKGQVTGVLAVSNHTPDSPALRQEDVAYLEDFAHQAGLVESEGQAHRELERRVQQLSTLSELGLSLFQAEVPERLMDLTLDRVTTALGVSACHVVEVDWQAGALRTVWCRGTDPAPPVAGEPVTSETVAGKALLTGRTQHHHHYEGSLDCGGPVACRSILSVPIQGRDRPVGAITVYSVDPHHFDDDDRSFLEAAAAYLSLARRQVQRLHQMADELEQLDALIEQVGDAVLVSDTNLRLVRANQVSRAMMGLGPNDMLPSISVMELLASAGAQLPNGEPLTPDHPAVDAARRGERTAGMLFRVPGADESQTRWIHTTVAPIWDSAGNIRYLVSVGRDVTEQQQAERAKDQFLSVVSHELKTPLTAIKGFAQLLNKQADKAGLPPAMRQALALIDEQTNRMVVLVNELLDVSRIQLGQLRLARSRVDAVALARRVLEQMRSVSDLHELRLSVSHDPIIGLWDGPRLERVLSILLDNAIRYQPQGGPVEVMLSRDAGHLHVEVRDQGIGIEPSDIPHLFERFYRAAGSLNHQVAGLGLGLYIAAEVVRMHGGELQASSKPGEGSRFWLDLPLEA